jgi:hypothetical protein
MINTQHTCVELPEARRSTPESNQWLLRQIPTAIVITRATSYTPSNHRGCIIEVPDPCGLLGNEQRKAQYSGAYNGPAGLVISASSSLSKETGEAGLLDWTGRSELHSITRRVTAAFKRIFICPAPSNSSLALSSPPYCHRWHVSQRTA